MQQTLTLTTAALLKYTLSSIIFAAIILLTIILPAEYNIDPTGIGKQLGLTVFSEVKAESSNKSKLMNMGLTTQTIEVIVPAGRGVEYKFIMDQFKKLEYEWTTTSTPLYFDLHGEPEGDTTGYFESYAIATLTEMKGSFTTPFAGSHGWYWKNTTDYPIAVKLIVKGEYISHSLKQ
jgi:hypothetical protein